MHEKLGLLSLSLFRCYCSLLYYYYLYRWYRVTVYDAVMVWFGLKWGWCDGAFLKLQFEHIIKIKGSVCLSHPEKYIETQHWTPTHHHRISVSYVHRVSIYGNIEALRWKTNNKKKLWRTQQSSVLTMRHETLHRTKREWKIAENRQRRGI